MCNSGVIGTRARARLVSFAPLVLCVLSVALSSSAIGQIDNQERYVIESRDRIFWESTGTYTAGDADTARRLADLDADGVVNASEESTYLDRQPQRLGSNASWIQWDAVAPAWSNVSLAAVGLQGPVASGALVTLEWSGSLTLTSAGGTRHTLSIETVASVTQWNMSLKVPAGWTVGTVRGATEVVRASDEVSLERTAYSITVVVDEPPAPTIGVGILLAVAFIPPLFFLIRIRNTERFSRNPMPVMLFVFAWGAIVAIILAFILEDALHLPLDALRPSRVPSHLWMAVILAPLVEEPVKVAGLFLLRKKRLAEEEDGLVYGAAAGLGFAATENLAYELAALAAYGTTGWLVTSVLRTLTSTLLHASSSAMAGWGVAKARRNNEGVSAFLRLLLIAMLMHGLFNFFASMTLLATEDYSAALLSLLLVFIFASFVYRFTRAKIRELDRQSAHPRVG